MNIILSCETEYDQTLDSGNAKSWLDSDSLSLPSLFSLLFCLSARHASIFLKQSPYRVGSVYKKAMFRQYTDASYSHMSPRSDWLGFLGPVLRAEVDDVIVVHLKNFASRNYSIHPHGVFYEKNSEGKVSGSELTQSVGTEIVLVLREACLGNISQDIPLKGMSYRPQASSGHSVLSSW